MMSHAAASRGGPFLGQAFSAQARLLEGLLGRIEVAEIPQQRRDRLRACRRQGRADPVRLGHGAMAPGLKAPIGRIS